jgi:uncharacterized RDD family membrane protein YckC
MKTTEIITTHNIAIEYELAGLADRILAFIIDYLIISGYYTLMLLASFWAYSKVSTIIIYVFVVPVFMIYHLISEIFFGGQSLGKKAIGIRVVKLNGSVPDIGDYFLRWVFRIIDIGFSIGSLAALFISSTEKNQRIGDIIAGTALIRLNPKNKFSVNDILTIKDTSAYNATYTNVTLFNDDDMLFVKNVLERYKNKPNKNHFSIITQLAENAAQKLAVNPPEDKVLFLKTLLQDYVVLTR